MKPSVSQPIVYTQMHESMTCHLVQQGCMHYKIISALQDEYIMSNTLHSPEAYISNSEALRAENSTVLGGQPVITGSARLSKMYMNYGSFLNLVHTERFVSAFINFLSNLSK